MAELEAENGAHRARDEAHGVAEAQVRLEGVEAAPEEPLRAVARRAAAVHEARPRPVLVRRHGADGEVGVLEREPGALGRARGFDLVTCFAPFNGVPEEVAKAEAVRCYKELAPKVDALYITVHRGVTSSSLAAIVDAALDAGVPTFSMAGSGDVRRGVLMSIAQGDFSYVGLFHAEVIGRIFNGAEPWALDQRWVAPAKIALNLETMEIIGFNPPVDILLAADEIYRKIDR